MEKLKIGSNAFDLVPMGIYEDTQRKTRSFKVKKSMEFAEMQSTLETGITEIIYIGNDGQPATVYTDCVVLNSIKAEFGTEIDGVIQKTYIIEFSTDVNTFLLSELKSDFNKLDSKINPVFNPNIATLEEIKKHLILESKGNLELYLAAHPITSKCHGDVEKQYTITKEKQTLLTQMIMIAQVAVNAGQTYQPSWNAQGEPCTYDWTLQELQQLAFEAEAVVRPLVSHQQTMEAEINAAETKENALTIDIIFGE